MKERGKLIMKKNMFPTKPLLVVALWLLSVSNFLFEACGDASVDIIPSQTACVNCSKCEYPCQQQQPSPPLQGYNPSYGAPPPPSPPLSGYSIYGALPPPPPQEKGQARCPPAAADVQCCTPQPPYAPPNPYTYVPNGEGQTPASTLLPVLVPLLMLFSSFVLF